MTTPKSPNERPRLANLAALAALTGIAASPAALAQESARSEYDKPKESAATPTPAETTETKPKLPLGHLSDQNEAPETFWDALIGGKVLFNNRLRFEFAEIDGSKPSYAITNRLRLGYVTKPYHGLSALFEFENVSTPDDELYFVPATGDGDPDRSVVADPPDTEVNQVYGRYAVDDLFNKDFSLDLRVGRQRIILDDSRFVGNVGWRQFEQTYDGVSVKTDLGVENLSVFYAYIWHVQRIFSEDGLNFDSDSHLINLAYKFRPELTLTPFAYILDFDNASALSTNTFGVRATGTINLTNPPENKKPFQLKYELTYAHQNDAGDNPFDYDADFFAADVGLVVPNLATFGAGYQYLGSDGGVRAFQFPLGTNHKFQGFADAFLATPADGLQDIYAYVKGTLPGKINGLIAYHYFIDEEDGDDFGWEIDGVLSRKITDNLTILGKVAYLNGNEDGPADRVRAWVQLTFAF